MVIYHGIPIRKNISQKKQIQVQGSAHWICSYTDILQKINCDMQLPGKTHHCIVEPHEIYAGKIRSNSSCMGDRYSHFIIACLKMVKEVLLLVFFGGVGKTGHKWKVQLQKITEPRFGGSALHVFLRFLISSQTMKHFPPIGSKSQIDLPERNHKTSFSSRKSDTYLHVQTYLKFDLQKGPSSHRKKNQALFQGKKKTTPRKGTSTIERNLYLPDPRTNFWRIFFATAATLPEPQKFFRVFCFISPNFFRWNFPSKLNWWVAF